MEPFLVAEMIMTWPLALPQLHVHAAIVLALQSAVLLLLNRHSRLHVYSFSVDRRGRSSINSVTAW
jgi:hypothetical protein